MSTFAYALPARRNGTAGRGPAHLSDEALLALVTRGDDGALDALYRRHARVAYGIALRVVGNAPLAEDAVQDAFLSVWRNARLFVPERGRAATWIFTLVHRRAVDVVRREQRRATVPPDEELEPQNGDAEDGWLRVERERVREALQALPDPQREAIELAYYGGFTQAELAERLGQPLGTIKSRMFAGMTRLRELLDDLGPAEAALTTTAAR